MPDKVGSVGVRTVFSCGTSFHKAIAMNNRRSPLQVLLIALLLSTGCGSILPAPNQPKTRFTLASLKGNYTYNLGGTVVGLANGYLLYYEAGTLVADGNGGLTGFDDFMSGTNLISGPSTGSYTINGDGTGTMILHAPGRQIHLAITMQSNGEVNLLEDDSFAVGVGAALAQAAPGTLSGPYVFRFYSQVVAGASSVAVGQMIVSGTSITGDEDVAQIGTASSHTITGTLTQPDNDGRGTLSLTDDTGNTSSYVYYTIDSSTLNFVRTDSGLVGEGRSAAQTGTPFTNASIPNGFTFHLGGDTATYIGGFNTIGAFTSDGKGNITSGSLDSVVDGAATTNESFTGTYSVDSSGRASITLSPAGASPISAVAWMADSTRGFFLQQTQKAVAAGPLTQQQGDPFSAASLNGEYSFRLLGFNGQNPTAVGAVGVMTFDGSAKVSLSDFVVSQNGELSQDAPVGGSYTVSSNGRAVTGPITGVSNSMVFYFTSATSGYILFTDPGTEISGVNTMQVPQ